MNFVRLGVMWEAVERKPGHYDDDYLNKVEALINGLGKAGIYTLVDAHQDVLARSFCGEGIPDFYAKEAIGEIDGYEGDQSVCISPGIDAQLTDLYEELNFCKSMKSRGYRLDENRDPLIEDCQTENFPNYYNTPEAITAFTALYHNSENLQSKFIDSWDVVSKKFASN
jgi:endoglycosylceramidase